MRTKPVAAVLLALVVVFGIWFYFRPHLAVRAMRAAAEARDAPALSGYINFPAVKESLKASFNARLASELMKEQKDNPVAALGAAFAAVLIGPMIDAFVTPESLAMMMKGEKLALPQERRPASTTRATTGTSSAASDSEAETIMSYESFDRFVVTVRKRGSPDEPVALVFTRDGLFSWKLSALRLPL
jgi:hypothetical protein